MAYVKPLKEFMKDSKRLVQRCTKPDLKGKPVPPNISPTLLHVILSCTFLEDFGSGIMSCLIKCYSPTRDQPRSRTWSVKTSVLMSSVVVMICQPPNIHTSFEDLKMKLVGFKNRGIPVLKTLPGKVIPQTLPRSCGQKGLGSRLVMICQPPSIHTSLVHRRN